MSRGKRIEALWSTGERGKSRENLAKKSGGVQNRTRVGEILVTIPDMGMRRGEGYRLTGGSWLGRGNENERIVI